MKEYSPFVEDNQWFDIPARTHRTDLFTLLVLDNSHKILAFGDSELHILDADNQEIVMYDHQEWREESVEVMGAILGAAAVKVES